MLNDEYVTFRKRPQQLTEETEVITITSKMFLFSTGCITFLKNEFAWSIWCEFLNFVGDSDSDEDFNRNHCVKVESSSSLSGTLLNYDVLNMYCYCN